MDRLRSLWTGLAVSAALLFPGAGPLGADEGGLRGVDETAADAPVAASMSEALTDPQLRERVERAITEQPSSEDARNIRVAAEDGRVVLSGVVGTETERLLAVSRAERVAGKGNVTDRLTVRE